ncbi:MAG: hypothetical protein JRJ62_00135 [Deltaproteobacteria bacterium]|nr:hypothetical protein [Deltaproteobacteria bacterium]
MFFRIFQHLLPNAKAWRLTIDKQLREFFEGLSGLGTDIKAFYDDVFDDRDPQQTNQLDLWENQWALPDVGLTTQERRDRLEAAWSALGGQDPRYIEDTLRDAGFDVYVHEWWVPGTEAAIGVSAAATPRNPLVYLRESLTSITYLNECGELLAECGELLAECGETNNPIGYALVNAIDLTNPIPSDTSTWPYFLYIGGQVFGDIAQVDPKRREEFETLCLKICPTQQWLGLIVEYT